MSLTRFEKDAVRRMVCTELQAHVDESELPLTPREVDGLARAAMRALTAPDVVVPPVVTEVTPMRREVLYGIAIGETAKQSARRLCVAEGTVKTHRRLLFKQLGVVSSGEAVAVGIGLGLIIARRRPPAAESADRLRALIAPSEAGVRP